MSSQLPSAGISGSYLEGGTEENIKPENKMLEPEPSMLGISKKNDKIGNKKK